MNPLPEEPKSRPKLGDTRNLPDHFARVAFKCFDDICDAFQATNEQYYGDGWYWRNFLYIRMVGQEFVKFIDLYQQKQDHDPVIMQELIRHQAILLEIGLLS